MTHEAPMSGGKPRIRRALRPPPRKPWKVIVVCLSVVALLALAAGVLVPNLTCGLCSHPTDTATNQMASFGGAIELYVFVAKALPPDLEALTTPDPRAGEPYIAKIPRDPWGTAYRYRVGDLAKREYEIRSAGPDERFGTDDDLVHPERTPP